MINFDVARGRVVCHSDGPTRTETDFVSHVQRTMASDPTATQSHFVVDNFDIQRSESLVRYIAEREGIADDFGIKYVCGVLRSRSTRSSFLGDPTHSIVFHYTPKHASWVWMTDWPSICTRRSIRTCPRQVDQRARSGSGLCVPDTETREDALEVLQNPGTQHRSADDVLRMPVTAEIHRHNGAHRRVDIKRLVVHRKWLSRALVADLTLVSQTTRAETH